MLAPGLIVGVNPHATELREPIDDLWVSRVRPIRKVRQIEHGVGVVSNPAESLSYARTERIVNPEEGIVKQLRHPPTSLPASPHQR